jgi:hypothetical protein
MEEGFGGERAGSGISWRVAQKSEREFWILFFEILYVIPFVIFGSLI